MAVCLHKIVFSILLIVVHQARRNKAKFFMQLGGVNLAMYNWVVYVVSDMIVGVGNTIFGSNRGCSFYASTSYVLCHEQNWIMLFNERWGSKLWLEAYTKQLHLEYMQWSKVGYVYALLVHSPLPPWWHV